MWNKFAQTVDTLLLHLAPLWYSTFHRQSQKRVCSFHPSLAGNRLNYSIKLSPCQDFSVFFSRKKQICFLGRKMEREGRLFCEFCLFSPKGSLGIFTKNGEKNPFRDAIKRNASFFPNALDTERVL
jgi:hypothetical protein